MRTIEIQIPDGYELDEDNSTLDDVSGMNLVLKPAKPKLAQSWEDLGEIEGWYINGGSDVGRSGVRDTYPRQRNIFATKTEAESSLAMAQLSQLMKHANGDWVPEWTNLGTKYCIERERDKVCVIDYYNRYRFLAFHDRKIRNQFLETHRKLIETYLMIPEK